MFTPILAAALAVAAPIPKPATPDLKWRFAEGDTFYVTYVQTATTSVDLGMGNAGAGGNNTTKAEAVFQVTVTQAADKQTTLELEFLSADVGLGGAAVNPVAPADLKGKRVTLTLDPKQAVTGVKGAAELAKAGGPGAAGLLAEDALKFLVGDLLRAVPGKPLGTGDKWTAESEGERGQGMTVKRTDRGRVVGSENGLITLAVESDQSWTMDGNSGVTAQLNGEKGTRAVLFDPKAGRVRKVEDKFTVKGNVAIVGGAGGNGNVPTITMTSDVSVTVTVTDDPPKAKKK